MQQVTDGPRMSRRAALVRSLSAAAAGLALVRAGWPRSAAAQTALGPDEALKRLMQGNARYTAGQMTSFQDDLQLLKQRTVEKQEPFAAVLSCADSRVPVEIVFDQSIGHVFVTRVAGNVATAEIIGSLEYGVAVLGTRVLMVLGHGSCGAVNAAMSAKDVPGQISTLYRHLRPAVDQAGGNLEAAIKANARVQARLLREASPVIAGAINQGRVKVVAAFYDLATGAVTPLE